MAYINSVSALGSLAFTRAEVFLSPICEKINRVTDSRLFRFFSLSTNIFSYTVFSLCLAFVIAEKYLVIWRALFVPPRATLTQLSQSKEKAPDTKVIKDIPNVSQAIDLFINTPDATTLELSCFPNRSLPKELTAHPAFQTRLKALKLLNFSLEFFPNINLPMLEELNLSDSQKLLAFQRGLSQFPNLKRLLLGGCKNLRSIPQDIGDCTQLEELYLFRCEDLATLPESLKKCQNLKELSLWNCYFPRFPEVVFSLPSTCTVDCTGASLRILTYIRERIERWGYSGPHIQERIQVCGDAVRAARARKETFQDRGSTLLIGG